MRIICQCNCVVQSASFSDDDFLTSTSSLVSLVSSSDRSSFSYLSLRGFNGDARTKKESSNRRVFWVDVARNAIVVWDVFLDMSLISRDIFLDPVEFEQRIHIKITRQMIQTPRATANPNTKATQALEKNTGFVNRSQISEL